MILTLLQSIQSDLEGRQNRDPGLREALENLKQLIGQIDHTVELIPLGDRERLCRTFRSLKGGPLSDQEVRLIDRINALCC